MLKNLSLRSKLILILLSVSLLAALIVIGLGYVVGVESISTEVYERLTSARNAKAFEIEQYFDNEAHFIEVLANAEQTASAVKELSAGFEELRARDDLSCSPKLATYYTEYLDSLSKVLQVRRDASAYYPTSAAACYLQEQYLVKGGANRVDIQDAGDGSTYSSAHARYHRFFQEAVDKFGFYDVFLVDARTKQIVYTAEKETDFATNLASGPYANSNLGELVRKVERNGDLSEAQIADFAFYRPSYGAPAAFIGSGIRDGNELIGILAFQLSVDKINRIMNYDRQWVENGLGESGEVLLVGEDYLLRSDPRGFLVDPDNFMAKMETANITQEKMDMIDAVGPILITELNTDNITRALRGERGITKLEGYAGGDVLSAFTPIDLPGGLRWALVTEINEDEAMAPVARFQRLNMLALAGIIGLITVLAMGITRWLIKPIDMLTEGAEAVRAGDTKVRVTKRADDEMGRLTEVFNGMVASIDAQKEEIVAQTKENNALLYSRFPDSIAERYRNGESNIVDRFEGVTVVSVDIRGTNEFEVQDPVEAWQIVQELSTKFNREAEEQGMEIIHAVPDGYLAVCGMNIPRLDNGRRVAILALHMRSIIEEVNKKYELRLRLSIGLAQGSVLAGILQDQTKNYVVWGPTIDAAQRLASHSDNNLTLATESIMTLLEGNFAFGDLRKMKVVDGKSTSVGVLLGRVADLANQPATGAEKEATVATKTTTK